VHRIKPISVVAPSRRSLVPLMPEWEYTLISLNDLPLKPGVTAVLSLAGKDGWELVTITSNNIAYLKRQIRKPTPKSA
jgi:hypothetical protein